MVGVAISELVPRLDCVEEASELVLPLDSVEKEAYGMLDPSIEVVMLTRVVVSIEVADEVVNVIVVPLMTVTVDTVDKTLVLPLGRTGD